MCNVLALNVLCDLSVLVISAIRWVIVAIFLQNYEKVSENKMFLQKIAKRHFCHFVTPLVVERSDFSLHI
jgi:hypothetical protein